MAFDTIPSRLLQRALERPDGPAYHERRTGTWVAHSWSEYLRDVRRAGRALIALGFVPGNTVAILGFNSPEWAILDLAAMAVGGAPAGIYTTSSPSEIQYVAGHCEARVLLLESAEQWGRLLEVLDRLPSLQKVVTMPGCARIGHPSVITWDAFLALGDGVADGAVDERIEALRGDQLATLIYTSGTTGPPKGVMLSHDNLAWTAGVARDMFRVAPTDTSLSYLPLSHIAEQMFTLHLPLTNGCSVYFAESLAAVPQNVKEVQPTVFFGVPRIWEKFHAGISAKASQAPPLERRILGWARGVGTAVGELRKQGRSPGPLLALQHRLADRLVFSKLKPAIGMGRARLCVSGAAPIAREVLDFFQSLDLIVQEVYGQSEDTGPTSFNLPGRVRFGTVGQAIPGVELKLDEDGEICVRGRNVFLGYYKDPEATAQALAGGWLRSGDLGRIDAEGFLEITGRKKEIIITAGGKNVSPKNLEAAIKRLSIVEEAVVVGDRRKYLTALITLNLDASRTHSGRTSDEAAALAKDAHVVDAVTRHLESVNQELARVEQIKHFRILPRSFSIETGELTPTLKIRRSQVHAIWADAIDSMYTEAAERAAS